MNTNPFQENILRNIDVNQLIKKYEFLKGQRGEWQSKWQMIQDYIAPNVRNYSAPSSTQRLGQTPINRRASFSSAIYGKISNIVSRLNSQLCDPTTKWLHINFSNTTQINGIPLNEIETAVRWLDSCTARIYDVLSDPSSNFYPSTSEFLMDWYTIGTACREIVLRQDTGQIRFNTISMQNVFIDINGYNEIENVYRVFSLNIKQAYDLWGDNIAEDDLRQLSLNKQQDSKLKEYIEVVMRSPVVSDNVGNLISMPWIAIVIDKDNKKIVNLQQHFLKPYVVSRFACTSSSVYGISPVWQAMPDIVALNRISKRILESYDYAISPPLLVKDITSIARYHLSPNSYIQGLDEMNRPTIQPLNVGQNLPFCIEYYNSKLNDLDEVLMSKDIFDPYDQTKTATEINQRAIWMSQRLRPVLVRLEYEDLNNTIRKLFSLLLSSGQLPSFPFQDVGLDPTQINPLEFVLALNVSFTGNMAQMMKMQDFQNNQMFIQQLAVAAQINPSILDLINLDEAMRSNAEILGISPNILLDSDTVSKIREARQNAQQQQAQLAIETQQLDNQLKERELGIQ